jgi:hypothetical protein
MTKIAICYWGLPRSIKLVYKSQKENVFDILTKHNIEFDKYAHFWRTANNRVWDKVLSTPLDYESIPMLQLKECKLEDQSSFTDTLKFEDYYYRQEAPKEWLPDLILNHLCALESMKRCVNMILASNVIYDYIMFLRADALVDTILPVKDLFNLDYKTIAIPNYNHHEGLNDRFAVMRTESALYYSHRINRIAEYRRTKRYIVSEAYTKYIIDNHYIPKQVEFKFRLMRSDGTYSA